LHLPKTALPAFKKAHSKIWDKHYFNSGLLVLHPSDVDFAGLADAFTNNTLTFGRRHHLEERDQKGRHPPPRCVVEAAEKPHGLWILGGAPLPLSAQSHAWRPWFHTPLEAPTILSFSFEKERPLHLAVL